MEVIKVNTKKSYEIRIAQGLVDKLPQGFVVTDSNVARIYSNLIPKDAFIIQAGEQSKTLETYSKLIIELAKNNAEEIIAFGGGVVGDIAGFAASTYKRSTPLVHVPTTFLAMIDASIGGKNGVNIGNLKNYVGTIYQPSSVLIDPRFLSTLPYCEFRNGMAEVIKYSILFRNPAPETLLSSSLDLEQMIFDCCNVKARVVEIDELDLSYRHCLNFGHTIGHAIELIKGLPHGEAISIGMSKEAALGFRLGFTDLKSFDMLESLLKKYELPIKFPAEIKNDVLALMKKDKKGEFTFAFSKKNYSVKLDSKVVEKLL